jgi:DNA-directed RNA polymerase specialized sigma24 family protein
MPRTFKEVLGMVHRLTGSNPAIDQDDIAQEITIRCWQEDRSTTWLEVNHLIIDRVRQAERRDRALSSRPIKTVLQPAKLAADKDLVSYLLSLAKPRDAALLKALKLEGQTVQQLAAGRNITPRRVRQLAARAIEDIRQALNEKLQDLAEKTF